MSPIVCLGCFARFRSDELLFRCLLHKEPHVFRPPRSWWQRGGPPPRFASCTRPDCRCDTGYRACPHCGRPLPLYVGRMPQRIIALTGCSVAGKTVYLWSLIHQLWEQHAREYAPFAVAMFEDEASYAAYAALNDDLVIRRVVPEPTQRASQETEGVAPVIVRLLLPRGGRSVFNAAFYDPAGELVQSLQGVSYLHYLAHASGLIFLVDARGGLDADERAASAADGFTAVTAHLRQSMPAAQRDRPLPHALAVVLTKADEDIFSREGPERWVAGLNRGARFWHRWPGGQVWAVSRRVETLLHERGFAHLVRLARNNYRRCRFFAVSALGAASQGEHLPCVPAPVGVENPLFWLLTQLR